MGRLSFRGPERGGNHHGYNPSPMERCCQTAAGAILASAAPCSLPRVGVVFVCAAVHGDYTYKVLTSPTC